MSSSRLSCLALLLLALLGSMWARERSLSCLASSLKTTDSSLESSGLLPSARHARLLGLGYDQLMADLYWLAFVGYEGDTLSRGKDNYALCAPYLELITGLDPHFIQAYWFCAFSVGADQKRPDLADKIIKAGIEANPDSWYLPYIAGLNAYLYGHDETKAAKYYRLAARFPEAPHWLAGQANILESRIPSIIKEIRTWDGIYRSNEPEKVRNRAREQLVKLWLKVFNSTKSKEIKARARQALIDLDYELN
ncbi:MAG TPA: hypothetical protein PKC93_18905 [Candidatus Obscuribacter sp.]|nr:hypothetical protein [Candidatus Obscuribacter sp.]